MTRLLYDSKGVHIARQDSLGYCFPPWDQQPHPPNPLAHRLPSTPLEWEHGTLLRRDQIRDLARHNSQEFPKDIARILANEKPSGPVQTSKDSGAATRYDAMGRLAEEIDALGRVRSWKYDPNGNVIEYTDADGATYRNEYASWNLLHRKIDPLGNATTFQYSARERITKAIDAGVQRSSEYSYDYKNRLVKVWRNGALREEYRYDAADNLILKLDGNGEPLLTFEAGAHNLHLVRRLTSGENHYFAYNKAGRFTKAATDEVRGKFRV